MLNNTFKLDLPVIIKSDVQLKKIVAEAPPDWEKRDDIRRYIAFIKVPVTAPDVISEMRPKDGIDFVKAGDGVVYMTTLLSSRTKSGFTKIIGKPVYKDISLRDYKTVKKFFALMEH